MASAANSSQLFLLSDHVKLSLLERQRALSLNLEPNAQDGQISRSLDQLRAGIESLRSTAGDTDRTSRYVSPCCFLCPSQRSVIDF